MQTSYLFFSFFTGLHSCHNHVAKHLDVISIITDDKMGHYSRALSWRLIMTLAVLLAGVHATENGTLLNDTTPDNATQCVHNETVREVSWSYAYWTLVVLALNAMTQSSPSESFLPASALSMARSSPLICLADMLITTIWTTVGWWNKVPLRYALALARKHLAKDNEDGIESLQNGVPSVALVFFIMGPLPQAIKLIGLRGVPITQALGVVYVVVYLMTIMERLSPGFDLKSAPKLPTELVPRLQSLSRWIYVIASAAQALAWVTLLLFTPAPIIRPSTTMTSSVILLLILMMFMVMSNAPLPLILPIAVPNFIFIFSLPDKKEFPSPREQIEALKDRHPYIYHSYYYLATLIVSLILLPIVAGSLAGILMFVDWLVKSLAVWIMQPPSAATENRDDVEMADTTHQSSDPGEESSPEEKTKDSWIQYWSLSFAVSNFVVAFICYCQSFNPLGTSKPAWTEALG